MKEREQPICKGTNKKGELIWGFIRMPLWQQAMFPIKVASDFINWWWARSQYEKWGRSHDDEPSMRLHSYHHLKRKHRSHPGD